MKPKPQRMEALADVTGAAIELFKRGGISTGQAVDTAAARHRVTLSSEERNAVMLSTARLSLKGAR